MASVAPRNMSHAAVIETVARELVTARSWGEAFYINLPLLFPSGTAATVRVNQAPVGFRVDDGGFAYRELESVGAERAFPQNARKVAAAENLQVTPRMIFTEVGEAGLFRAICDVGIASRDVVERVYGKLTDASESELADVLQERLEQVFGKARVTGDANVVGASSSDWEVSAVVHTASGLVVFQAVGNHPNSIYRTSAAFHDMAELPDSPVRVAVVKDRTALGPKLHVLAQAGRVIQGDQTDDVYKAAAA